jgi:hypothetical protein
MRTWIRLDRQHGFLIAAVPAAALVVGVVAGALIGRATAPVSEQCEEALDAASAVAAAIEAEWQTASEAVDAAQRALADSRFRDLEAACRD